jgi:GDP-4-dehydro-6-deoxy-D-mannose reductase
VSGQVILVTGAGGFVGRHLMARLRENPDVHVFGTALEGDSAWAACDLSEGLDVTQLLAEVGPTRIYHCAGTFTNQWQTDYAANVLAARNLCEALVELKLRCRLLLIGSAAEYGWPPPGPVPESAPLAPVSVYGLTKSFQTRLMDYYRRRHGLEIVMARAFNLFGDGCSPLLFPGRVAEQIQQIKSGQATRIKVGPLDSRRDYLPVEQAVEAYLTIMERGAAGEVYNVGSGEPVKLADFLARLLAAHGLTMAAVDVAPAVDGEPRNEVTEIYADISKLKVLAGTVTERGL